MFKKVNLTVLLLLLVLSVFSQNKETTIKFGANISALTNLYIPKLAFHAGISGMLPLSDLISFHPELVLSIQGSGKSAEFNDEIWYVNFPMGFQYRRSNTFWRLGPQVGTVVLVTDKDEDIQTVVASYNPYDFSLFLGFGFMASEKFDIELRYNRGLNKSIEEFSNVVLQLSVHYKLSGFNKHE